MKLASTALTVLYAFLLLGCQTPSAVKATPETGVKTRFVKLHTRPGVVQKFILLRPAEPMAAVILFAGGHGNLQLSGARSMGWGKNNFLVRTRTMFAKHGLMVAVVDAPSDMKSSAGMNGFRSSSDHVTDIEAVVSFLSRQAPVPVWLVGTSRGTVSAAHIANNSQAPIAGLVLTASMGQITFSPLTNVKVPALIVHHKNDRCRATPPVVANTIAGKLSSAPKAKVLFFDGGWMPQSDPCEALSQHGFYGIEKKVVKAIAEFIQKN